jgi:hypothetical protein
VDEVDECGLKSVLDELRFDGDGIDGVELGSVVSNGGLQIEPGLGDDAECGPTSG